MKTGYRKNRDLSILIAPIVMVFAMLACNLPTQSNAPGQGTPTNGPGQSTPTPTQPGGGGDAACLPGIFPGTTTRDEVVALLGDPLAVEPEGGIETLLYASPLRGQFNSIALQNQVVALVSIVLGEDNPQAWSDVKAQYGEPAHTAFSNYLQWSMTYVYPDRGLAFVADEGLDAVFIRDCFVPMSLEDYMNTWGKSLPAEDPFTK